MRVQTLNSQFRQLSEKTYLLTNYRWSALELPGDGHGDGPKLKHPALDT